MKISFVDFREFIEAARHQSSFFAAPAIITSFAAGKDDRAALIVSCTDLVQGQVALECVIPVGTTKDCGTPEGQEFTNKLMRGIKASFQNNVPVYSGVVSVPENSVSGMIPCDRETVNTYLAGLEDPGPAKISVHNPESDAQS